MRLTGEKRLSKAATLRLIEKARLPYGKPKASTGRGKSYLLKLRRDLYKSVTAVVEFMTSEEGRAMSDVIARFTALPTS